MNTPGWAKPVAVLMGLGVAGVAVALFVILLRRSGYMAAAQLQHLASPGPLSASHAFLGDDCAACHTAARGPDPAKCIGCHADNKPLLQRAPTAFHAAVGSCRECHGEHQGGQRSPTTMDHAALAKIGLRMLKQEARPGSESGPRHDMLAAWIRKQEAAGDDPGGNFGLTPCEATLDCAACHGEKDRHFRFFGADCARCHVTTQWTISEFRHPSPRSKDCAQCHQAPPCHYMTEHFNKVCAVVAGQPQARVNQCYLCHQTTAWNDIKGFGWCKCH